MKADSFLALITSIAVSVALSCNPCSKLESKKCNYKISNSGITLSTKKSVVLNDFENATRWAEKEELTYYVAKQRRQKLKEEVQTLKEYIQYYDSTTSTIYRYVQTLQRLKERMALNFVDTDLHEIFWGKSFSSSAVELAKHSVRLGGSILEGWPNRIDLDLAMHSLTHIQEVYGYDFNELQVALSPETKRPPKLGAFHSAQVGLHALSRKHFAVAIQWMEHSVDLVNNECDRSIPLLTLESYLEVAVKLHNRQHFVERISKNHFIEYLFVKEAKPFQRSSENNERISNLVVKLHGGSKKPGFEPLFFNGVCSGADFRSLQELTSLYCWYDTSSSPARTIQPYKKELLSTEPEVIQVYDFLGEKLIASLMNEKTNCNGIPSAFDKAGFSKMMRLRTPTSCDFNHLNMDSWWKKVSSLTLTHPRIGDSHTLKTVDYLYGRLFAVHRDSLQFLNENSQKEERLVERGDRIFTMVFYLNDVPAGGATAFTGAGMAAHPVKGSVVFWTNLFRNGSAREDSWHGSCPVIYGHKQVAIVLIRSNSQIHAYPCTLNKFE